MSREDTGPICIIDPDGDTNDVTAAEKPAKVTAFTRAGYYTVETTAPSRSHYFYKRNDLADAYRLTEAADESYDDDFHSHVVHFVFEVDDPVSVGATLAAFIGRNSARRVDAFFPHPRRQLVVAARPMVIDRVRSALESSTVAWRTPPSLARQLEISEAEIRSALKEMGAEVRHPIAARNEELDYYRLSNLRKTWQERVRWLLLVLGRTPPAKIR